VTGPEIDRLRRRDLKAIMAIEDAQFDDPWSERMLRDELASPTRRYTKATASRRIVGYLGLMVVDDDVHVNTLATAPGAEGRGIATALLAEGLSAVALKGVHDATLEVAARNARAQRLYVRFGFAPVGVRRAYYPRSGDDAIVMWARGIDTDEYAQRLASILGA
jgi:ribosomal-protein-alanine N-acetyltransferase